MGPSHGDVRLCDRRVAGGHPARGPVPAPADWTPTRTWLRGSPSTSCTTRALVHVLHCTWCTAHSAHMMHRTFCTVHSVLFILHCTFCTAYSVLHILYCSFCTAHDVLHILYCTFCTAHNVLHMMSCTLCTAANVDLPPDNPRVHLAQHSTTQHVIN